MQADGFHRQDALFVYSYSEYYVDAATALGLEERLQIISALKNSSAARAGVPRGMINFVRTTPNWPMYWHANSRTMHSAIRHTSR